MASSEPVNKKQKIETEETLLEEIDTCQNEVKMHILKKNIQKIQLNNIFCLKITDRCIKWASVWGNSQDWTEIQQVEKAILWKASINHWKGW